MQHMGWKSRELDNPGRATAGVTYCVQSHGARTALPRNMTDDLRFQNIQEKKWMHGVNIITNQSHLYYKIPQI